MALDKDGRKFTNCTAVDASFELKGVGILQPVTTVKNYSSIVEYTQSVKDLLDIKLRFD
jgi:hypothetical protein